MSTGFDSTGYEPTAEPVYGFRAFSVDTSPNPPLLPRGGHGAAGRGLLTSVFKSDYRWDPEVNTMVCNEHKHPAPVESCMCGFWAYTRGQHFLTISGPAVFGIVEAWGPMVIGPKGFRAKHARIVALCFPVTLDQLLNDGGGVIPQSGVAAIQQAVRETTHGIATVLARMANALRESQGQKPMPMPRPPVPPPVATAQWSVPDADLRKTVTGLYAGARVFPTVRAMQDEFPLTDLSAYLPSGDNPKE